MDQEVNYIWTNPKKEIEQDIQKLFDSHLEKYGSNNGSLEEIYANYIDFAINNKK